MTNKILWEFQQGIDTHLGLFEAIEMAVNNRCISYKQLQKVLQFKRGKILAITSEMERLGVVVPAEENISWETLLEQEQWTRIKFEIIARDFSPPKRKTWDDIENSELPNEISPNLLRAIELSVRAGQISIAVLNQKCGFGYAFSAEIMKKMEDLGVVQKGDVNSVRKVMLNEKQWQDIKTMRAHENSGEPVTENKEEPQGRVQAVILWCKKLVNKIIRKET